MRHWRHAPIVLAVLAGSASADTLGRDFTLDRAAFIVFDEERCEEASTWTALLSITC